MSPTPPQKVGPYEIIGPLGSGGMGQVFRARDPRLNREVAVKLLPPEYSADPMRKQRFEQEARAIAALNHPGIVSIYDVGDGWMVTELIEGETLRAAYEKGELTQLQLVDLGAQIAEALAAAHETGISHRDLKPENVLLTPDGRTKILDFGLAKVVTPATAHEKPQNRSTLTNPGVPTGTPGYMSPEQVRGQESDYRSDIFSLGLMLYEMLAGKPAFQADSAVEVMHAIVTEDPPELPQSVPDGLRRIIKRCIEKKPALRFQSARDLAFALRAFAGLSASAKSAGAAPTARRTWLWPAVGAGIIAAGIVVAFLWLRYAPSLPDISSYQFHPFAFTQNQEFSGVWSPDGQSIAFVEQTPEETHLMVQSLDAPAPTQLAVTAQQPQPVWSADGTRIYFLRGNSVFAVSRAGGQPDRVVSVSTGANVSSFHVSRDGKTLALWKVDRSKDGVRGSVWISSPPGAEPQEYSPHPFEVRGPFTPVYLRFSPDTKLLYLSMYTDAGAETWLLPFPAGSAQPRRAFEKVPWNRPVSASWMPDSQRLVLAGNPAPATGATLWLADARNESMTPLLADPDGGQTTPSVSPDGKRLLFSKITTDRDIVELPLDGSAPRTLLATSLPEFSPTWSPTGDQFAYVTRRNGTDELWVRSTQGNWDRPVVTAKEFPTLEAILSPSFSPDGSRIAYTALIAGGGRRRSLAISPASGGSPTIVADGYAPSWSPDGSQIAFLWIKPDGSIPMATISVGSERQPHEIAPANNAPEWSPSGQWIAVSTFMSLTLVSPDGKDMRTLPAVIGQALAWSKDSKTIYGLSYNTDPPSLKALDVATGNVRMLAEYHVGFQPLQLIENSYTGSIRISMNPDGKSVAVGTATSQADLWILDGALK